MLKEVVYNTFLFIVWCTTCGLIAFGLFYIQVTVDWGKYLKKFLRGCANGLLVLLAIGMFILGVYLVFSALEHGTWDYIIGLIVYIVVLFGLVSVVD